MSKVVDAAHRLPQHALERLKGLRSANNPKGVATSDFTVPEFLMVRKSGFEPVGLCVGSCMYHIRPQFANYFKNQEMGDISQAMYHARELAMSRMREEARIMGADGIVGTRLEVKRMEWDEHMLEFMAIGTGIVHSEGHKGFKGVDGQPFTSSLSGQDFWMLLQAGYRPLEMVMGSCVYHVAHRGLLKTLMQTAQNVELENYSQALLDARELAQERMQDECHRAGGELVIAGNIHEGSHGWATHLIEFFAVGTAIIPLGDDHNPERIGDPQLVLSVN